MDFGTGVDTASGSALNVAVTGAPSVVPGFDGSTTVFHMEQVETIEDLATSLGISAQASGSYGLFSASLRFNYAKSCNLHSSSVFSIVSVNVTEAFTSIKQPGISPGASTLLANGQTDPFRAQFGDMFVRGILGGGQFFATIEVTTKDQTDKENVSVGLKASYAAFSGSATFDQTFQETVSTHHTIVRCFIEGGQDLPIPVAVDTMTTRAVNFHAVPYVALLNDYGVLPLPQGPNFIDLQQQKDVLARCSILRNERLQWSNEIAYIDENPQQFIEPANFALNQLQNEVNTDLNTIAAAASQALNFPKQAQQPTALKVTAPAFPQRVAGSSNAAVIDLAGVWVESTSGHPGPIFTLSGSAITVDMSTDGRPQAHGTLIDSTNISVTFPDDGRTFIGKLIPPGTIFWSNDTAWIKPTTAPDPIFDLNGNWEAR